MTKTTDLTKGSITSSILGFYFPMLLTNMLQQLYTVADTAIVGKGLGDEKLAAVGNMSSLTFLIFGFAIGLANGFSVVIAQSFGARNGEKLRKSVAATVKLFIFFSIVLTSLSVGFLPNLLNLIQTDAAIMKDGLIYGYIIFGGLIVTLSYNLCSGILRALGDSKTPFFAIIVSSAINIVLDFLFIFGFKTGVEGAAIATVISQVASTLICFSKIRNIDELHFSKEDFVSCNGLIGELVSNGLPMALMNSITAIGCIVLQYFINGIGLAYTEAYSACSKYINLFMQPACTAGFTISAFTSQNYGAKEYDRIRAGVKVCFVIATVSYLILGSLMVFIPRQLALIMLNGDEAVSLAAQYLIPSGIMIFAVDYLFIFRSTVQGMGKPIIPMISGIAEMIIRVVVVFTLIENLGFMATAYAQIAAWVGALIMNFSAYVFYIRKVTVKSEHRKFALFNKKMKGQIYNG
ncbi:MAG: MATE family efflux transporter [Oscillospiraceae bacterium]|nr:MATE family efflux transporter [Oscillospiraceae bacterium]